jgi:hypothetical protein
MSFEKHGKIVEGTTPAIDVPGQKCAGISVDGEPVALINNTDKRPRGKTENAIVVDEDLEFPED